MDQERRILMTPKLVDSLYVEAMVLADEARSYFDVQAEEDRALLEPGIRVHFACESLRVTTRLMHVIAWLLTRRAVAAGEISSAEGRHPERKLGEAPESDEALLARLPDSALALIRSSQELYGRVRRIEEGGAAQEPQPSPARGLISRLQRSL